MRIEWVSLRSRVKFTRVRQIVSVTPFVIETRRETVVWLVLGVFVSLLIPNVCLISNVSPSVIDN